MKTPGFRPSPPPSAHLRLFWREKKHLMTLSVINAIRWEFIIPVALFNWSVITY
jgi:hypothetical protein